MPGNKFKWNSYNDDNLVAAFDMSTRTPGGLMKNLARTGATYDAVINGAFTPANPLIRAKTTPSMLFDGVANYIQTPAFTAIPSGSIIMMYETVGNWPRGLVDVGSGLGEILYGYQIPATRSMTYQRAGFQVAYSWVGDVNGPRNGNNGMLAVTHDSVSGAVRGYMNGRYMIKEQTTISVAGVNFVSNGRQLYIGLVVAGGNWYHPGRIDLFLLYDVILTPAQIQSIWRSANVR